MFVWDIHCVKGLKRLWHCYWLYWWYQRMVMVVCCQCSSQVIKSTCIHVGDFLMWQKMPVIVTSVPRVPRYILPDTPDPPDTPELLSLPRCTLIKSAYCGQGGSGCHQTTESSSPLWSKLGWAITIRQWHFSGGKLFWTENFAFKLLWGFPNLYWTPNYTTTVSPLFGLLVKPCSGPNVHLYLPIAYGLATRARLAANHPYRQTLVLITGSVHWAETGLFGYTAGSPRLPVELWKRGAGKPTHPLQVVIQSDREPWVCTQWGASQTGGVWKRIPNFVYQDIQFLW